MNEGCPARGMEGPTCWWLSFHPIGWLPNQIDGGLLKRLNIRDTQGHAGRRFRGQIGCLFTAGWALHHIVRSCLWLIKASYAKVERNMNEISLCLATSAAGRLIP